MPCHCDLALADDGVAASGPVPGTEGAEASASAAGLAAEPVSAALQAALGGPFIDAHTHLFPDRLMAAIFRAFHADGYALHDQADTAALRQHLLATGAARLFVLVYAHKAGVAESLNAWLHDLTAAEPRLVPFGSVHADDPDRAALVERCFTEYGFPGLKLHASVQRTASDDERLDPVYAACVAHRRWVIIHAGSAPYGDGFTETASAENLLRRHPDLRVVFAHLGMWDVEAYAALARKHPNVYLDCSSVLGYARFAEDGSPDWLRPFLIEHADKILWGSDFPFLETPYASPLQALVDLDLPPAVLARLRVGNARTVLASVGGPLVSAGGTAPSAGSPSPDNG
jgi:predicted TIM-barrel fold metal-dependent hydrolase